MDGSEIAGPGPVRTCVGCRRRASQVELVRIARSLEGQLVVSRTAPGRGAWLCQGRSDCFDLAQRRRAFDRALRVTVGAKAVLALRGALFGNDQENLRDLSAPGPRPGGDTRPTKG